ncbi:23S rRNA (uracil(1939)-C(5))-methyltransferase RlmD [Bacillus velezensis]|uniref:23S rRNA (uracil(1939)-C(5))-methyltransferase RlmD n=1 Tax=Bacillus velezensis TaxID=492670 RepID=UPI002DB791D2|nr:23S rRNA (uracil(1939)-C(5))-methyltransferase RlmD [Bacillus velezensis]MEC1385316.1 23S rRNA (uracil(1939)-C(5))-methyltransferase RlmD [Bacillus velezensis]
MNQHQKKAPAELKIGQTFPLTIKRLGINGEGVGYFKKKVVFVPGALPGEEVVAEATNVQPKFSEARVKKIRKPSEHRVTPPCPVYDQCGGCQLQHLAYTQQLREKRDIVIQSLERHTRFNVEEMNIKDTIGMDNPWNYRNKSQFQVGRSQSGSIIAGLYGLDSHKIVPIKECIVQHPATNKTTGIVRRILEKHNVSVYNERTKKGDVRTIVTRVGFETGEVQVVLVTAKETLPNKDEIVKAIQNRLPEVKSIIQNVNGARTSVIFGDKTKALAGSHAIQEVLGDVSFELSARAFFQLNPEQTVKLYDEVKQAAQLTGKEKVVDAYCGVGTIGMWVSSGAKEIRGMDVIKESIDDAKKNAKKHDIKNAAYVTGTAEHWLPKWTKEGFRPDVVIVDPPRTGCDRTFLDTIKKVKPKRFVYVSCNPSTLAKDLQTLSKDYRVEYIQPVDMFPQTAHVEAVVKLVLKSSN